MKKHADPQINPIFFNRKQLKKATRKAFQFENYAI